MTAADPLLVTLRCGGAGWTRCEELRKRYFPPARNIVPAHIVLFHHLPGQELETVLLQAGEIAAITQAFWPRVSAVRSLGRGVALVVESPELRELQRKLAAVWESWLIPQDRVRYSPHITVQNKVSGEQARALLASLASTFQPFSIDATGVDLWHYRNGPWEHAYDIPFSANQ